MKTTVSDTYFFAGADSLAASIVLYARRRMFERFLKLGGFDESSTVLDIGVTSDESFEFSNHFEKWLKNKSRITALGLRDASNLIQRFPDLSFVRGDALHLPFRDQAFDFVHSSAVLEHVGSRDKQRRFIEECGRVARVGVFLTTPNRWFPIEVHTRLPLLHWLPMPVFRSVLSRTRYASLAREDTLNLVSPFVLNDLSARLTEFDIELEYIWLTVLPSNIMFIAYRRHMQTT